MQDKEYPSDGAFQVSLHVQRDDDRRESEPKRLLAMIDAATIGALSGIFLFGAVLFVLKLCVSIDQDSVVRRPIDVNLGLKFNPGFFKSLSRENFPYWF